MENRNFINGEFINSISNSNIAIEDPSNKKTIANIDEALDEEISLTFNLKKISEGSFFLMIEKYYNEDSNIKYGKIL